MKAISTSRIPIKGLGIKYLAVVSLVVMTNRLSAQLVFTLSFDDPGGTYSSYYPDIASNLGAAEGLWSQKLTGSTTLDVVVKFDSTVTRAYGASVTSSFVETSGGFNVLEQGAAAEIRTGTDPNGTSPDIEIGLNPSYLMSELWFDPHPNSRSDSVPSDRTDSVTVFLHELGHAFAFNGWRDGTGAMPGNYMSTFDRHVSLQGSDLFFNGAAAVAEYGGPVPVTYGNPNHIGNSAPRPGSDLIPDLMNGVVFDRGSRYSISDLDLAIMQDTGMAVVPEPDVMAVIGALCFIGAIIYRRRKRGLNVEGSPQLGERT